MGSSEIQTKILKLLDGRTDDVSIHDIAKKLKISRQTVSKNLEILEARDKVTLTRVVGRAKMWRVK